MKPAYGEIMRHCYRQRVLVRFGIICKVSEGLPWVEFLPGASN